MAILIGVDDGHEDQDSGAVANGLVEVNINKVMGDACRAELKRNGVATYEPSGSLDNRINLFNQKKVTCVVSFHNNAGK